MEHLYFTAIVINLLAWIVAITGLFLVYSRFYSVMNEILQSQKQISKGIFDLEHEIEVLSKHLGEGEAMANLKIGARKDSPSQEEQDLFRQGSSSLRWKAVSAAAQQADRHASPENIETLIASLRDDSVRVRLGAMSALARTGDLSSVPSLIELLSDENEVVRRRAKKSLSELTSQDFGEQIEAWRQWWERKHR